MKRLQNIFIALLLAANCSAADSINDVLKSIRANNITLKAMAHQHQAAVLDIKAENSVGAPSVEYSPFWGKHSSGIVESELIVSEEFEFPTKYALRSKQARIQGNVNEKEYAAALRDILLQAETLCCDIIRVNNALQLQRNRLQHSTDLLAFAEKRLAAGDANILELNKAKLDLMEVKTFVAELENEREALVLQLTQLNGGVAIDCIDSEYPSDNVIPDLATLTSQARVSNASVQLAEENIKAMQHGVSMSKGEWLPNITMGYRRNTDMSEAANGVLIGVSLPLFGQNSKVKAAKERLKSAQLSLSNTQSEVESRLMALYSEWHSTKHLLENYDYSTLQTSLTLLGKAQQHGEINLLQYYTEVHGIYSRMQSYIELKCKCAKLEVQLKNIARLSE